MHLKRVIIFAGMHKTASSFIQNKLVQNSEKLKACGYGIIQSGLVTTEPHCGIRHSELTKELVNTGKPGRLWERARHEISTSNLPAHIIMHEDLFSPSIKPIQIVKYFDKIKVESVICFRNPVDYLESRYREFVHRRKLVREIQGYMWSIKGYLDYSALLRKWEAAMGESSVMSFQYEHIRRDPIGLLIKKAIPELSGIDFGSQEKRTNETLSNEQCLVHLIANRLRWSGLDVPNLNSLDLNQSFYPEKPMLRLLSDRSMVDLKRIVDTKTSFYEGDRFLNTSTYIKLPLDPNFSSPLIRSKIARYLVSKDLSLQS